MLGKLLVGEIAVGEVVTGEIAVGEVVTGEIVLGKLHWGNELTPLWSHYTLTFFLNILFLAANPRLKMMNFQIKT